MFLGAQSNGNEAEKKYIKTALSCDKGNVAGLFHRIGPNHYRLSMPEKYKCNYRFDFNVLELRR